MYLDIYSQYIQGTNTTTVLTGGDCQVLDGYYPVDGADDTTPVIDQFDLWLNGTEAENKAMLAEIRLALESAKKFKDTQRRAYIRYSPYTDTVTAAYRSRILSGRVIHNPQLQHHLNRERMKLTVIIERDPWWETIDNLSIPLTNGNGTDSTTAIRVYNCGDNATVDTSYKRDNWVTIDGVNDIIGDMPAPIYFQYTVGNLDVNIRTIHAFNNVNSYPTLLDSLIEAEEYGADTVLTGASNGNVGSFTITSGSDNLFWYLDIDNQVKYASVGYFVAVMRFKYDQIANLGNLKFKVELYEATRGTIFKSDYFYPRSSTGEPVYAISPVFRLQPEEVYTGFDPNGYTLRLYAYQETGGDITLIMDDIHLLPVEEYRKIGSDGYDIGDALVVYDVQHLEKTYKYIAGSGVFPIEETGRLCVHPGVSQKITFIFGMTTADTQAKINSIYVTLAADYYPRRRTI